MDIKTRTMDSIIEEVNQEVFSNPPTPESLGVAMAANKCMVQGKTKEDIDSVYQEIYDRKILRPDVVLLLHNWALSHNGYAKRPKYFPNEKGEYQIVTFSQEVKE